MGFISRTKPGLELVQDVYAGIIGKTDPSLEEVCHDLTCMDKTEVTESAYAAVSGKSPSSNGPSMPVTMVSYKNAKDCCERMGRYLPSSEAWGTYAGPEAFATRDGNLLDRNGKKEANFGSKGPMAVGSSPSNGHGMDDMTGNVWEWVVGGVFVHYLRGGSWYNNIDGLLRVDNRYNLGPDDGSDDVGFRCMSKLK